MREKGKGGNGDANDCFTAIEICWQDAFVGRMCGKRKKRKALSLLTLYSYEEKGWKA